MPLLNNVLFQAPCIQSLFRNFQLTRLLNRISKQSPKGRGHSVFPNLGSRWLTPGSLLHLSATTYIHIVPLSIPQLLLSLGKQLFITASHQLASTQDCIFMSTLLWSCDLQRQKKEPSVYQQRTLSISMKAQPWLRQQLRLKANILKKYDISDFSSSNNWDIS